MKSKVKQPNTASSQNEFQWLIWTIFALENWILDFGRPIAMVNFEHYRFKLFY